MERKIRIGAVSYLNTKPLLYGLENGPIKDAIELIQDYPSNLVKALKNDQIDIGLIPVAALLDLEEYHIVSDYCIGTEGEVASVCVFSEVPMEQIDKVILDYQSRTSVMLCKILFEQHWKKKVQYMDSKDESYIEKIKGNVAGLVIGDRALKIRSRFSHIYDLGLGWKEMTGLPFVFAVWVSKKTVDPNFLFAFNQSNEIGIYSLNDIGLNQYFFEFNISEYYKFNISYNLSEVKITGMNLFFDMLKKYKELYLR